MDWRWVIKVSTWRPSWTKPFVKEPVDLDGINQKLKQRPPTTAIHLFLLCLFGLAIQPIIYGSRVYSVLIFALWLDAALTIAIERPRTGSISLALVFVVILAVQLGLLFAQWSPEAAPLLVGFVCADAFLAFSGFVLVVNMPLREPYLSRAGISAPFTTPNNSLRSPEDNLSLWQWMSVSWMASLINVGNQRQLHDEDVWQLSYEFQHRHLHDTFRELHGSVTRRILRANCIDVVILSVLALLQIATDYSAPILLQKLLQAMQILHLDRKPAINFAILMLVVRLIAAQNGVFGLWFSRRCYERSRGEMIMMLYEKTLHRKVVGGLPQDEKTEEAQEGMGEETLEAETVVETNALSETTPLLNGNTNNISEVQQKENKLTSKFKQFIKYFSWKQTKPEAKLPASLGKILNLMKNDAYEVAQRFWELQNLITTPVGLVVSLTLIWKILGPSSLAGIAVVVVAQLINAFLAKKLIDWERVRRSATDSKLQLITQYVEAIRHLRWYGWHSAWLKGITEARQKELNLKVVTSLLNVTIFTIYLTAGELLPIAAFYAYTVVADQQLRVDIAFPALQLFSMLQRHLYDLPNLITTLLNARVAMGRIEDFMAEPDKAETNVANEHSNDVLEVKDASFAWPGLNKTVLHDLNLSFPTGLTLIFGSVGSGKSALLQALLGELDLQGGELSRPNASIGYCAQTPWLQSMSIRENITFTSSYDDARYKQTLQACALTPDLATFKDGDLSNIGENGIGLSGGQKARVALARAVYGSSKILLLDDPLSALDQQTAELIVEKCLTGPLVKDRTIILVTHRTDLCKGLAQQLIEVINGTARVFQDELSASSELNLVRTASHPKTTEEAKAMDSAAVPDKFVEDEHRAHGSVQAAVYWQYIKAGKIRWWSVVVITATLCQLLTTGKGWFLKEWGEAYNRRREQLFFVHVPDLQVHLQRISFENLFDRFPDPEANVKPWLLGYLAIGIAVSVGFLIAQCFMVILRYRAGKDMFNNIMLRISGSIFRFYDVTPVGRLMNRLTSDVGTVDGNIANQFVDTAWYMIQWTIAIAVIASVTPFFMIFALALTAAFVFIFLRFIPTSQSLRRLEMVSLSPLMSNFGALLTGLTTVRAFCAQPEFQSKVIVVVDAFQKMDHFYWSLQSWLTYRFDSLAGLSTFLLTLLAVFSNLTPGLTAFVLIAAGKFVESTHSLCRKYGQLQLDFVSVERVVELLHIEQEDPGGQIDPPASWPRHGSPITFENMTINYSPTLPPALSDISVTLHGGTTTAIIGRTGSGKSTLALSLLATTPPTSGRILIDGIDISKVPKQTLRERITFLAQEPILFPGTIRHNLDPLDEHPEHACAAVLSRVCANQNLTLEKQIEAGGKNLSQGQRQLVGLARAILRRSAVVIMDEATASVDLDTAWEVQRLLREEMQGSTVVTIAHRAAAVRDVEGVVVLENGRVKEVQGNVVAGDGTE